MGHAVRISFENSPRNFIVRHLLAAVFAASALFIVTGTAAAESVSSLHYSNNVNDFAHVLSDQTVNDLDDACLQLNQQARAQVAEATINSLDASDLETYSVDWYKRSGIGNKATTR